MSQGAHRDIRHPEGRQLGRPLERHAARRLGLGGAADPHHCLADVVGRQIVEQHDVGASRHRLVYLVEGPDLDLERHLVICRLAPSDGLGHRTDHLDVVVLDQQPVVEPDPVVGAAARPHGVLLEGAKRRGRLAGIQDDGSPLDGVDELTGHRRDAGHPLQKVERRPLRGQKRGT